MNPGQPDPSLHTPLCLPSSTSVYTSDGPIPAGAVLFSLSHQGGAS